MLIALKLFSNSKVLFFVCFYVFDVSNDPSLYIMIKKVIFSENMLKIF